MASSVPVPTASTADEKTYTLESLKEHSSRESLWMLLHDKVYDVTRFMDEHPGGDEVLLEEAGRDATEAFEDVGHSDEARAMLPKMFLGEFKGEKKDKSKKSVVAATAGSKPAGSASLTFLLPIALLGAYLAWRFLYA